MRPSTSFCARALTLAPAVALQTLLCSGSLARSWFSPKHTQGLQALDQLDSDDHLERRQIVNAGGISYNVIGTCLVVSLHSLTFLFASCPFNNLCLEHLLYPNPNTLILMPPHPGALGR